MTSGEAVRDEEARSIIPPCPPHAAVDEMSTRPDDSHATRFPDGEGADHAGDLGTLGPRYRVLREHATGGLGQVFVALDRELNREVALKEIREERDDDWASRSRFLLEAEVTGCLEHPGIVPVYGLGRHSDGRPYYAMRFIRGESLRDAIKRVHAAGRGGTAGERTLGFRQLLTRYVAVCNALAYAHSKGVIHRDIKPDNIMLGKYGETLVVDWGLAKAAGARWADVAGDEIPLPISPAHDDVETRQGSVVGTPRYMSPEQAAGDLAKVGPPSDIYSLGATLYAILTGRAAFEDRDQTALLRKVQSGEFTPPRGIDQDVPKGLEAICLKAMALDPEARYASASELAEDVERHLADEPVRAWREPWTIRARRWARRHQRMVAGTAAGLLVAVLAGAATLATTRARGLDLVDRLQSAEIPRVPDIVAELAAYRFWAGPKLAAALLDREDDSPEKLRVALGLLPVDPGQVGYLARQVIRPSTDAPTLGVIRDAMNLADREAVAEILWPAMSRGDEDSQFRAACMLASYAAADPRWDRYAGRTVEQLLTVNGRDPMGVGRWAVLLEGVLPRLVPTLIAVYSDPRTRPADRILTAGLLIAHVDETAHLVTLVQVAEDRDFEPFLGLLRAKGAPGIGLLREAVAADPGKGADPEREALAHRRSSAAIALARLSPSTPAWPLLKHTPDPILRPWLIDRLGPLGLPAADVARRIGEERDVSARRALILALGQYPEDRLPAAERSSLAAALEVLYRDDPDPGVHSAIDWLLRRWKLDDGLRRVDRGLARGPTAGRSWFVNSQGQTFAVLGNPPEFRMGSPEDEVDRDEDEVPHLRTIGRSFAVATTEVTVAQYRSFLEKYPQAGPATGRVDARLCVMPDQPKNGLNWYLAAMYCRWLSDVEGLPEKQMCYPKVEEILQAMNSGRPLKLPPDSLRRTGYRLPTEAEWEYACRAGAASSRSYGSGKRLLSKYAWFSENSDDCWHPVGELSPNDFGLFDILGNLRECCQPSPDEEYTPDAQGRMADEEFRGDILPNTTLQARGGSRLEVASMTRSAFRNPASAGEPLSTLGMRPVRTMP